MKKTMVYILALSMVFSALLTGCGDKKTGRPNATPTPTTSPEASILPENMMPDPDDGNVNDDDGIITDDDNGPLTDDPINAGVNDLENDVKDSLDNAGDKIEEAGDKLMGDENGTKNP